MALNQLLNQFLGQQQPATGQSASQASGNQSDGLSALIPGSIPGGLVGELAAGGLLGVVIGNKKMRKSATKMAGGAIGLGGAAALGVVAYKAYQSWQSGAGGPSPADATPNSSGSNAAGQVTSAGQSHGSATTHRASAPAPMQSWDGSTPPIAVSGTASTTTVAVDEQAFDPQIQTAADGTPFQTVLLKAMIVAANADGHIDDKERRSIFDAVGKMDLEAEDKAIIFDMLMNPPDVEAISKLSRGLEQASEIYLVSRLAIDPDEPSEQAYLQTLANQLQLPNDLVIQLENQLMAGQPAVA